MKSRRRPGRKQDRWRKWEDSDRLKGDPGTMEKKRVDRIGYDSEEAYFDHQSAELVREHRAALDRDRMGQPAAQGHEEHWMVCPRCGSTLREIEVKGVRLDQCSGCQGIYFDAGELDLFVQEADPERIQVLRQKLH